MKAFTEQQKQLAFELVKTESARNVAGNKARKRPAQDAEWHSLHGSVARLLDTEEALEKRLLDLLRQDGAGASANYYLSELKMIGRDRMRREGSPYVWAK
jgi:hypothetical protein